MDSEVRTVRLMLEALLKSSNHIHWIGGYVYGRTSNDDPFVILYPASPKLEHKATRVYQHDFKKLPPFVDTANVPADTDGNPKKSDAQRRGIYHACPMFQVVTYDGRETQMGDEKRFYAVLAVTDKMPADVEKTAVPQPAPKRPLPSAQASAPRQYGNGEQVQNKNNYPAFDAYVRQHKQSPRDFEMLKEWAVGQRRGNGG